MKGAGLVARSLARSWRRHRLQALAAFLGVVVGAMLATTVASVSATMVAAIEGGTAAEVIDADVVAVARSASGISDATMQRLEEAAGPAESAGVLRVNTAPAGDRDAVLAVFGVTAGAARLVGADRLEDATQAEPRPDTAGLVVGQAWAGNQGLEPGDVVELEAPGGTASFTVTGVVDGDLPNQGAIGFAAIDDVDATYERDGQVDAVYFRLGDPSAADEVTARLQEAGAGSVSVGPPSVANDAGMAALSFFQTIFALVGFAGFAVAGAVLLVCWRLLLDDERPSLARFRLVGGGPRQLVVGSGLVFGIAALLCAAVGVPLGFLAAGVMEPVSEDIVGLTGYAGVVDSGFRAGPAVAGVAAVLVMAGVAWATSLRSLLRLSPIEGFQGVLAERPRTIPLVPVLAVAAVLVVGFVVALLTVPRGSAGVTVLLALAATVALAVAAPTALGRLLSRREGFVSLAAGRELEARGRRRATVVAVFAVADILVVLFFGLTASLGAGVRNSVEGWTGGDLFVLAGRPGLALRDERLADDTPERLAEIPGVDTVTPFTLTFLTVENRPVQLWAWDTRTAADTADLRPVDGVEGEAMWDELAAGAVAVSETYAYLQSVDVGDEIDIPSVSGTSRHEVVAVIPEYTVAGGVIYSSLDTFQTATGDRRMYDVLLNLEPGADRAAVAGQVREELADYPELVVWTGAEMLGSIMSSAEQAFSVFDALGMTCLILALMVGATTAAASVAARRAPLALARVVGASAGMTRRQLWLESSVLGVLSWLIALPIGIAATRPAVESVGSASGLFPPAVIPVASLAAILPLTIVAMALALWLPVRSLLRTDVAEVLRNE